MKTLVIFAAIVAVFAFVVKRLNAKSTNNTTTGTGGSGGDDHIGDGGDDSTKFEL